MVFTNHRHIQIKQKKNIIFLVLFLFVLPTSINAKIINFKNCKVISDPGWEAWTKSFKIDYNEKEHLKKQNEKYIYVNRSFDLNSLTGNTERKSAETKKVTKVKPYNFYFNKKKNKLYATNEGVFAMSKLDKNKSDIYRVVVMEVNLEKQTITKWSYMGPEKEIQTVEKCKSNYKPSSNKKNYLDYWWAVILIIAITFFIFTQSGKRLKQIRRK